MADAQPPTASGRVGTPPEAAVLAFVPPRLRAPLERALPAAADAPRWLEVRLRRGGPLGLVTDRGDRWIGACGAVSAPQAALRCEADDLDRALQLVTRASVYAWEDELARGFCTLPGGHRAGLAGRAILRAGRVAAQKEFSSLNLRVARAAPGAGDELVRALAAAGRDGPLPAVLIYGPPGCGKTTVLRDLCRQLSAGRLDLGLSPRRVGVVDERSELAASAGGMPQFDLGPRTDVLDGWPKPEGLRALIRAMGPEVVACDEIGGASDARALAEAGRCGVSVMATAHAAGPDDLRTRPGLRAALHAGVFALAARLSAQRRLVELAALRRGGARPQAASARLLPRSAAREEGGAWSLA